MALVALNQFNQTAPAHLLLAIDSVLRGPTHTIILLTISNIFMTFAWYGH
jgi:hypothetical protein